MCVLGRWSYLIWGLGRLVLVTVSEVPDYGGSLVLDIGTFRMIKGCSSKSQHEPPVGECKVPEAELETCI